MCVSRVFEALSTYFLLPNFICSLTWHHLETKNRLKILHPQDGYKLFEFDLTSQSTKPVSCPGLRGRVQDVSLSCTGQGCVPVALVGNRVIHCKSGPMTVQDSLTRFSVLGDGVTCCA